MYPAYAVPGRIAQQHAARPAAIYRQPRSPAGQSRSAAPARLQCQRRRAGVPGPDQRRGGALCRPHADPGTGRTAGPADPADHRAQPPAGARTRWQCIARRAVQLRRVWQPGGYARQPQPELGTAPVRHRRVVGRLRTPGDSGAAEHALAAGPDPARRHAAPAYRPGRSRRPDRRP
ncbi:hypothetical protein G6F59_013531 [Rhizopus arrhizus]|nr:hypothetical protein G6F59_013531 [Rhizopus arrhizus]